MLYLQRQEPKRGDLSQVLPGVRSVVCVALNYSPEASPAPSSRDEPQGNLTATSRLSISGEGGGAG